MVDKDFIIHQRFYLPEGVSINNGQRHIDVNVVQLTAIGTSYGYREGKGVRRKKWEYMKKAQSKKWLVRILNLEPYFLFDTYWNDPYVYISYGKVSCARIYCRSNSQADEIRDYLRNQIKVTDDKV